MTGPEIGRGWFVGYVDDVMVIHARVEVGDEDFAFYLALLAREIDGADETRRGVFYDLERGSSTDAQRRKRLAEVLTPRREKLRRIVVGCAIATPSAIDRGIATALVWLTSPPHEVRFVPGPREAFAWLGRLLPALDAEAATGRYFALKKACCESPDFR
jgi:hypothetical protein